MYDKLLKQRKGWIYVMKHSIAIKIFAAAGGLFLLVLIIQWLLIIRSFNDLYYNSMLSSMQNEFLKSVQSFTGGNEDTVDLRLRRYALETGSPVMVFTENYEIADVDFMNHFSMLEIKLNDDGLVKMPVTYLDDMKSPLALSMNFTIFIRAVRIGNSSYYEPLIIKLGEDSYTNRESMTKYRIKDVIVDELNSFGTIRRVQYVLSDPEIQRDRAKFIYRVMKDCLIQKLDIDEYLDKVCSEDFKDSLGDHYRLFSHSLVVDGKKYYFVTVQKIIFSGQEKTYINRFFYGIYAILGIFLITAAFFLSRYLSKPLVHLSEVTQKITKLDFSQKARIKNEDELGQLSRNINVMSDSLEKSLSDLERSNYDLKAASEKSKDNEKRMKLLLADLAHEFKTPLGVISSYIEVVEKGLCEKDTSYYFNIIDKSINNLTEMVNDVIELSKLQAGNWRVELEIWDLNEIITSVLDKFQKRFHTDGFTVKTDLVNVTVTADARRIEQVIMNFISNAMKYSDTGKKIEIITTIERDDFVTVYVGNSGYISESERERIWERYYKSPESSNARLPSEGIGLDIVKSILVLHKSQYGVKQSEGMTYFYFTLQVERTENKML